MLAPPPPGNPGSTADEVWKGVVKRVGICLGVVCLGIFPGGSAQGSGCLPRGCLGRHRPPMRWPLLYSVCILLECILVSQVSVILFGWGGGGGVPMWLLPAMHFISLYRVPPNTKLYPFRALTPSYIQGPNCLWKDPVASDTCWPRLEACSNLLSWGSHCTSPPPPPVLTSGCRLLKHVQWASGYTSYRNAFLFSCQKIIKQWSFSEIFSLNSVTKIFVITVKGLEPATSCVREQDATTVPARHIWERVSLN